MTCVTMTMSGVPAKMRTFTTTGVQRRSGDKCACDVEYC